MSDTLYPYNWGLENSTTFFTGNQDFDSINIPGFSPIQTDYGETVRGMVHVSPLAAKKTYGLSIDEIISRYFPDASVKRSGNVQDFCDVDSSFSDLTRKNTEFVFARTRKHAFNVYLFYSKDAIKLAEAHECLKAGKQEIVFLIEDNTGDSSDRYAAVTISGDILNDPNVGRASLKNSNALYKYIKGYFPDLSTDQLEEIITTGRLEYRSAEKIAALLEVANGLTMLSFMLVLPGSGILINLFTKNSGPAIASKAIELIANKINLAKFDDYRWNPEAKKIKEDGTEDTAYNPRKNFSPILFPGFENNSGEDEESLNDLINKAVKTINLKITEQDNSIRSFLKIGKAFNPDNPQDISEYIYAKYSTAVSTFKNILEQAANIDLGGLLQEGVRVVNAFFCGIWNGIVDAVSGIFLMVKYIFDAIAVMSNIREELPLLLEHFDNIVQAFRAIDFSKIITHIKSQITDAKGNFTIPYIPMAYFCGAVYGFIISLIIEIAIGILISGGTLSVAAVVEKLTEIFTSLFRAGTAVVRGVAKGAAKTATFTVKALYKALSDITELLRKGTDEFLKMIDEFFNTIKASAILSSGTFLYSEIIPINAFFNVIKLAAKSVWISQLNKIGFQIAKLSDDSYTFVHNGIEIFNGTQKEAKEALEYYFKNVKNNNLQLYLDNIADIAKIRNIAYTKWISKFEKKFHIHFDGEFTIGKVSKRNNTQILYAQGAHNNSLIGSTIKVERYLTTPIDDVPFDAIISVKYRRGMWINKISKSTMFPKNWNIHRVKTEIALIYDDMISSGFTLIYKNNKYVGKSSQGFDILIEVDDLGNITNAYPY